MSQATRPAKPHAAKDVQAFKRINLDALPASLRELVAFLGETLAFKLVGLRGGQMIAIPKKLGLDHSLVYELGAEGAAKLVESFGGATIEVPKADSLHRQIKHRRVVELIDSGASYNRVASLTGYTRRHAINIGKQSGGTTVDRQFDLFWANKWHEAQG